jgi:hypothetical protein
MKKVNSFKNLAKVAVLTPIIFSYNTALALTNDFGANTTLKAYLPVIKNIAASVMALAVIIFGVQLAIAYFNEQGEQVKKKAINFFVGLIVFFIIYNITI